MIFAQLARACLLLLAAKRVRSTLDTKEGYKTKRGFTISVTLPLRLCVPLPLSLAFTLFKTEYWDGVGG